ncbi:MULTISPECIES: type IV pilus modification PilV family protein [Vibrio]|uniref:Prepilin-type N-terminal cleavage/methylation domain-containing protein n=1 Tax=Vibrio ostreae TaxID=2841925 RepID=A0A975U7N5_9VIBR|nr:MULTISPECIES: prepilin-type N-terminal cleavage/methylation domain-containing protein [Vibrio]QXO16720.1 prepilin-type N-terminal cleavage/methylation domain-containing protein [Vibrio ostreae]WGY46273.1 prepilin-type N-terminal cleavage/methylation domain-containing protein [Vibrio sp. ABG19]
MAASRVRRRIAAGANGFSLIEVMIAFILVSVGLLGLMSWQLFIEQRSDYAQRSGQALALAEQKLTWFYTRGAQSSLSELTVADFARDVVSGEEVAGSDYRLVWSVTLLSPVLKSIRIEVIWRDRLGVERSIELSTLLSRYAQYQADDE